MDVPDAITCVECGGLAHRSSFEPHEGFEAGQLVTFACEDCNHRMDVVLDEDGSETGE